MVPIFLHFMSTGDVYVSADVSFTPAGTVLGTYRFAGLPHSQKLCTITATAGAITAVSNPTGKFGKEIV